VNKQGKIGGISYLLQFPRLPAARQEQPANDAFRASHHNRSLTTSRY